MTAEGDNVAELVEEVDSEGRVLRVVTRAEMRNHRLRHRAVFIAVVNTQAHLLVHRRASSKDLWPSFWDIACGGVVGPGESWRDAANRELAEELGVAGVELEEIGGGAFDDEDAQVIGRCFVARSDGPFVFTDGEVTEAHFVDAAGLEDLISSRPVCPDSVALVRPLLGTLLGPPHGPPHG